MREKIRMNSSVKKLSYRDLCDDLFNLERELDELNEREKVTRIIFDHPLYLLRKGLKVLNKYNKKFAIFLEREGYSSYDYKKIDISSSVDKNELGKFTFLYDAVIEDYGYQTEDFDHLTCKINSSEFNIKLDKKKIEHYKSKLAFKGYFKGHGDDFAVAEQYEFYVQMKIFGILEKDLKSFPDWKLTILKAFISYSKGDYENSLTTFHAAFEIFLKEQIVDKKNLGTSKFKVLFSNVMKQNKLTSIDLTIYNKSFGKNDLVYYKRYQEYNQLKKKRNTTQHEKHVEITKKDVEDLGYIMITFVYSIMLESNMFLKPWIKGLE